MIFSHDLYTLISCNFFTIIAQTGPCCLAHARTYVNVYAHAAPSQGPPSYFSHRMQLFVRRYLYLGTIKLSSTRLHSVLFEEIEFQ